MDVHDRPLPPLVRLDASGTSPGEAAAALPAFYAAGPVQSRPTARGSAFRCTVIGDSLATVGRAHVRGSVRARITTGDDYVVQWLTSGDGTLRRRGTPEETPARRPVLALPGDELVFEAADFEHWVVHLSRSVVHDAAAARLRSPAVAPVFDQDVHPAPAAIALWRATLADADALAACARPGGPAWRRASRDVADAFLELFPPRVREPEAGARTVPVGGVRRAVAFVDANAHRHVSADDIADAAGLSVRAVQEGFQRTIGETPMTYLRNVRLDRVRADLVGADPDRASVTGIAERWGFGHLGRFAAAYRQRFGERPRDTLHRARADAGPASNS